MTKDSFSRDWSGVRELVSKEDRKQYYEYVAGTRDVWQARNPYYHQELAHFFKTVIPEGSSVLQIGCGTGNLLAALRPSRGVGLDFSPAMLNHAREKFPHLTFIEGDAESLPTQETFQYIVMSNIVGDLTDVWQAFRELRGVVAPETRIVVAYYNYLWEPLIKMGEKVGIKMPQFYQNWMAVDDLSNLFHLNSFEVVRSGYRILLPFSVPLLSACCNRFLAKLPGFRRLSLMNFLVARPLPESPREQLAVSVIVPTRNEAGNVDAAVSRIPQMGLHTEIIFVDGDSADGTVEKIEESIARYQGEKDIKLIHQVPRGSAETGTGKMLKLGKGDAVRKGFEAASGDILMILDSDLTVPPEDLPKFYLALAEGRAEFANGTRLVYQMERQSMRLMNLLANKTFGVIFSWLLEQRVKDTLCGTKVLFKRDYERIKANRSYFGDFDPFGDFDLLFGAARLNLRIVDVPIRYRARVYGETKINRWRHGVLLLRMCVVAFWKLKLC